MSSLAITHDPSLRSLSVLNLITEWRQAWCSQLATIDPPTDFPIGSMVPWANPKPTMASIVDAILQWMFPTFIIRNSSTGFQIVIDCLIQFTFATAKLASAVNEIYLWLMALGLIFSFFYGYDSRPQWLKDLPRRQELRRWAQSNLPIYGLLWIVASICYRGIMVIEEDASGGLTRPWPMFFFCIGLPILSKYAMFRPIDLLWGQAATLFP